jgi:hypothetical protein
MGLLLVTGKREVVYRKESSRPLARSPRAVSEAPPSEELGNSRRSVGALRIQRLEGTRPRGLWDLYLDEPVLVVCEFHSANRLALNDNCEKQAVFDARDTSRTAFVLSLLRLPEPGARSAAEFALCSTKPAASAKNAISKRNVFFITAPLMIAVRLHSIHMAFYVLQAMYAATPQAVQNPRDDCRSGAHSRQHAD